VLFATPLPGLLVVFLQQRTSLCSTLLGFEVRSASRLGYTAWRRSLEIAGPVAQSARAQS
jgi:hypothetical protein